MSFFPIYPPRGWELTYTPTTAVHSTGSGSTTTHNSVPIGTAYTDRRVFCFVFWDKTSGDPDITSCTINSVSATQITVASDADSGKGGVALYSAIVPTGTSVTVTCTWDDSVESAVACYAGVGFENTSATGTISAGDVALTGSLSYNSNDLVLAAAMTSSGTATCSWTGVSEDFDFNDGSFATGPCLTAGHSTPTSGSPLTVTATMTSYGSRQAMVAVSWG